MLIDFHTHTTRCCHARGTMEAYLETARVRGIQEFGFSDHSHWMLQGKHERYAMRADEHEAYIADVRRMQERHEENGARPFHIRLGMEMDFIPTRLDIARHAIAATDWDYIIGSVHNAGLGNPQMPDFYGTWDIETVCEVYFHFVHMMIRARFCDIVGHIDLPKKYGGLPAGGMLRYVEPLIPDLKANDLSVEINTSGLDAPSREPMPGWDVIEALAASGVSLTLGSDAHAPHEVGRHFDTVIPRLKQLGIKELVRFERRQRFAVSLE